MKTGLISVILPVWKPNFVQLKKCIDSIVSQTYTNFEIVIIYKKSSEHDDKFFKLIEDYSDKKIKVVDDKNQGFPASLNEGIINSSGEFIARIDGDDFCDKDRFEKQLEFKNKHKCNVVGSWARHVTNDGKIIGEKKVPITHKEIRKKIMYRNPMLHPTILMDRSMLNDTSLYDPSCISSEDYELWFRIMSKNFRFGNVPEFLVSIGIGDSPDSITRGTGWKKVRSGSLQVKNKALLRYGFFRPLDILYYIPTPFYYLISPQLAMKVRKILKR